ncbi:hypothetical protein AAFF_G00189100 [Aldrovandia affinis]|uniref:Uncharacterized protein n=1 Tax=Aldrovandia affinis TaxID=143900 RepID=A0AAD7RJU4_9TELE|nr:hypothetical protein AAFF_G00189100 [Aldrovandia affinis]
MVQSWTPCRTTVTTDKWKSDQVELELGAKMGLKQATGGLQLNPAKGGFVFQQSVPYGLLPESAILGSVFPGTVFEALQVFLIPRGVTSHLSLKLRNLASAP